MVEDYVISCYNHLAQGDYNTEALIFKIAAGYCPISSKETNEKKNAVALTDNHLSNYTGTVILLRLSEYKLSNNPREEVEGIIAFFNNMQTLKFKAKLTNCSQSLS